MNGIPKKPWPRFGFVKNNMFKLGSLINSKSPTSIFSIDNPSPSSSTRKILYSHFFVLLLDMERILWIEDKQMGKIYKYRLKFLHEDKVWLTNMWYYDEELTTFWSGL